MYGQRQFVQWGVGGLTQAQTQVFSLVELSYSCLAVLHDHCALVLGGLVFCDGHERVHLLLQSCYTGGRAILGQNRG